MVQSTGQAIRTFSYIIIILVIPNVCVVFSPHFIISMQFV